MTHRLHIQVDTVGVARANPPIPLRIERFTGDQLQTPDDVARALERIQQSVDDATRAARSFPMNQAIVIRGVKFQAGVAYLYNHRLGRQCDWLVTRWRAASGAMDIAEVTNDNASVSVVAVSSGTGDLWIW